MVESSEWNVFDKISLTARGSGSQVLLTSHEWKATRHFCSSSTRTGTQRNDPLGKVGFQRKASSIIKPKIFWMQSARWSDLPRISISTASHFYSATSFLKQHCTF